MLLAILCLVAKQPFLEVRNAREICSTRGSIYVLASGPGSSLDTLHAFNFKGVPTSSWRVPHGSYIVGVSSSGNPLLGTQHYVSMYSKGSQSIEQNRPLPERIFLESSVLLRYTGKNLILEQPALSVIEGVTLFDAFCPDTDSNELILLKNVKNSLQVDIYSLSKAILLRRSKITVSKEWSKISLLSKSVVPIGKQLYFCIVEGESVSGKKKVYFVALNSVQGSLNIVYDATAGFPGFATMNELLTFRQIATLPSGDILMLSTRGVERITLTSSTSWKKL